jgi:carboxymethylenebutenolidase
VVEPPTTDVRVPLPGAGELKAALALPDAAGPRPGVILLHEAFGLNDDMRRIAGRFAANGYAAIAPDLFSHPGRARCLSRVLIDGFARGASSVTLGDIDATRTYLGGLDLVDADRMAVVGFCMGGGFALAFAAGRGLKAASVNYGPVPRKRHELEGICPVVASYGALDRVMANEPKRLEEHLTALGVPHDIKVYEGVGHSFLSFDNAPAWVLRLPTPMRVGYDETAAEDAWRRILAFFMEHVG